MSRHTLLSCDNFCDEIKHHHLALSSEQHVLNTCTHQQLYTDDGALLITVKDEDRDFFQEDASEVLQETKMNLPTNDIASIPSETLTSLGTQMGYGEETPHSCNTYEDHDEVTKRKRMFTDTNSRDGSLQEPKPNFRRNVIVTGRATRFRRGSENTNMKFSCARIWTGERTQHTCDGEENIHVTINNKYSCPLDEDSEGIAIQEGKTNLRSNGIASDTAIKLCGGRQSYQGPSTPGTYIGYGEMTQPMNIHKSVLVTITNEYCSSVDECKGGNVFQAADTDLCTNCVKSDRTTALRRREKSDRRSKYSGAHMGYFEGTPERHNNDGLLLVTITNKCSDLIDGGDGDDVGQQKNTNICTSGFTSARATKLHGRAVSHQGPGCAVPLAKYSERTAQTYKAEGDLFEGDEAVGNITLNFITNSTATMPLRREKADESDAPKKSETSGKRCNEHCTSTANSQCLRRRHGKGTSLYSETIRNQGNCTKSQGMRNSDQNFQSDPIRASDRGIPKEQPLRIRDWIGVPHSSGGHAQVEKKNIAQVFPHHYGQRVHPYVSPCVSSCYCGYRVQRSECEETGLTSMKCYDFAGTQLGHANVSGHNSNARHCLDNSRQDGWALYVTPCDSARHIPSCARYELI
ncbi:uncharacterized protein LOC135368332 [Ornithodoros turicata]|uniref:uncharacterized protein LOC135368332 n=1 Tax=Ornithodoros turicata TaxID=34597 RepID=UPI003138CE27